MSNVDARTQAKLELRRGNRAQPIPSKKIYKRKSKHKGVHHE